MNTARTKIDSKLLRALNSIGRSARGSFGVGLLAVAIVPAAAVNVPKIKPVEVLSYRLASEGPATARELLQGRSVVLKPGAEFLKLSMSFAEPVEVKSVAIETCTGEFADGIDFFFHPGQRRAFVEGGRAKAIVQVPGERAIRTLSIVLRHDTPACLKGLQLLDLKGNPVSLVFPELVDAHFENEDVRNLFNLAFDEPANFANGMTTSLRFEEPQEMDRLLIWNGDQLNNETFHEHPRVKKFRIGIDGGPEQEIVLADKEGVQEIALRSRLKGSKVLLRPLSSGRISEMRFGMGNGGGRPRIFSPADPEYHVSNSKLVHSFQAAGVQDTLDHELTSRGDGKSWHFRFRGDSSFFIYGYNEGEDKAGFINGLGRFSIEQVDPNKITIHLRGSFVEAGFLWDGWICGAACGERESKTLKALDETIVLEKLSVGFFMVRNRSAKTKRALQFTDLKSKVSSLSE